MTNKKMQLIDQLKARQQVNKDFTIQVGGQPFPVRLPRILQWAALAATFPGLNDLIQFKESDASLEGNDIEMAAHVVGLSMALQAAHDEAVDHAEETGRPVEKNPLPTPEQIDEFVAAAAGISDNELEQGFLMIFFESHLTHKRVFLEAADRAAELVENPGRGNEKTETTNSADEA